MKFKNHQPTMTIDNYGEEVSADSLALERSASVWTTRPVVDDFGFVVDPLVHVDEGAS